MAGSVQDVVKRTECLDKLSVDPELIQEVQLLVNNRMTGRNKEGEWQIKWLKKIYLINA